MIKSLALFILAVALLQSSCAQELDDFKTETEMKGTHEGLVKDYKTGSDESYIVLSNAEGSYWYTETGKDYGNAEFKTFKMKYESKAKGQITVVLFKTDGPRYSVNISVLQGKFTMELPFAEFNQNTLPITYVRGIEIKGDIKIINISMGLEPESPRRHFISNLRVLDKHYML